MTIKELYELVKKEVDNGNGDCPVFVRTGCGFSEQIDELHAGFSSAVYNSDYVNDTLESDYQEVDPDIVRILN